MLITLHQYLFSHKSLLSGVIPVLHNCQIGQEVKHNRLLKAIKGLSLVHMVPSEDKLRSFDGFNNNLVFFRACSLNCPDAYKSQ